MQRSFYSEHDPNNPPQAPHSQAPHSQAPIYRELPRTKKVRAAVSNDAPSDTDLKKMLGILIILLIVVFFTVFINIVITLMKPGCKCSTAVLPYLPPAPFGGF
jgi:hypothetical protein